MNLGFQYHYVAAKFKNEITPALNFKKRKRGFIMEGVGIILVVLFHSVALETQTNILGKMF